MIIPFCFSYVLPGAGSLLLDVTLKTLYYSKSTKKTLYNEYIQFFLLPELKYLLYHSKWACVYRPEAT